LRSGRAPRTARYSQHPAMRGYPLSRITSHLAQ
jgi:hypothetical protein